MAQHRHASGVKQLIFRVLASHSNVARKSMEVVETACQLEGDEFGLTAGAKVGHRGFNAVKNHYHVGPFL